MNAPRASNVAQIGDLPRRRVPLDQHDARRHSRAVDVEAPSRRRRLADAGKLAAAAAPARTDSGTRTPTRSDRRRAAPCTVARAPFPSATRTRAVTRTAQQIGCCIDTPPAGGVPSYAEAGSRARSATRDLRSPSARARAEPRCALSSRGREKSLFLSRGCPDGFGAAWACGGLGQVRRVPPRGHDDALQFEELVGAEVVFADIALAMTARTRYRRPRASSCSITT